MTTISWSQKKLLPVYGHSLHHSLMYYPWAIPLTFVDCLFYKHFQLRPLIVPSQSAVRTMSSQVEEPSFITAGREW
jgi:hypothetical protein